MTDDLVKDAFLATEAASSLAVYGATVTAFHRFGALLSHIIARRLITDGSIMADTLCAHSIVAGMSANIFRV
jgi:hypothetical protein